MKPILFCNVAWMKHYRGIKGDPPKSSASYVREHGTGSERHNFNPTGGTMRGFVQVKGTINLQRLGGSADDESLEGVTVVWVAPSPLGGTYIVGWYRNATVYKQLKCDHRAPERDYNITAAPKDCVLVPVDRRVYSIPRGKGGIGQSCVWFAAGQQLRFFGEVNSYIRSGGTKVPIQARREGRRSFARNSDPLLMQKVEENAIRASDRHYRKIGYTIKSVEKDNCGWDLEAYLNHKLHMRIEVKGLSGSNVGIEFTPNEFRQMKRFRDSYRICVATDALKKPLLYVFSYSPDSNRWEDLEGRELRIEKIIAARMHL